MLTPKQKAVLEYMQEFSKKEGYNPSQKEIAAHFGFNSLGTVQNYLVRLERNGYLEKEWNSKRGSKIVGTIPGTKKKSSLKSVNVAHPDLQNPALQFRGHAPTTTPHTSHPSAHNSSMNASSRSKSTNNVIDFQFGATRSASPTSVSLKLLGKVAAGCPIEYRNDDEELEVPIHLFKKPDTASADHYVLRVQGRSMIEDGILDGDYVIIKQQKSARNGETVVAMIGNEATIKRFYQHKNKIELRPANESFDSIFIDSLTETINPLKIEGVMVGLIRKL